MGESRQLAEEIRSLQDDVRQEQQEAFAQTRQGVKDVTEAVEQVGSAVSDVGGAVEQAGEGRRDAAPRCSSYGGMIETKAFVLPNCAGHELPGAGFGVAGPLPSSPC